MVKLANKKERRMAMEQQNATRPRDEATERIECYILQNNLKAHHKLPSERDMCSLWALNRSTLRAAVQRLIVEGKIYNRKGSGTYVAPSKWMRNLQDIKSTSQAIKEKNNQLTNVELSKEIIDCTKSIAQKLHLLIGAKTFFLRRLRIINNEPVMIETSFVDSVQWQGIDEYDYSRESLYKVLESLGAKIEKGNETIGITYATAEEASLLHIEENTPLFYLSGVSCDAQGNPIEYFKSVIRADKVRFASVLTC